MIDPKAFFKHRPKLAW